MLVELSSALAATGVFMIIVAVIIRILGDDNTPHKLAVFSFYWLCAVGHIFVLSGLFCVVFNLWTAVL